MRQDRGLVTRSRVKASSNLLSLLPIHSGRGAAGPDPGTTATAVLPGSRSTTLHSRAREPAHIGTYALPVTVAAAQSSVT